MRKNKYFTLILVQDEARQPKTFKVSRNLLKNLGLLLLLLLLATAAVLYMYLPKALDYDRLSKYSDSLTKERFKVLRLLDDYARIRERDAYIRRYIGLDMNLSSPLGYAGESPDYAQKTLDSLIDVPLDEISLSELPDFGMINFLENVPTFPPLDGLVTAGFSKSTVFKEDRHLGIDIAARVGDPVHAAAEGLVVFSGWTYQSGNTVIIYHGDDYFTLYGHNSSNIVSARDRVHRGDPIALAGNTGLSRGPHLHFEIWYKGEPKDPRDFIPIYSERDISEIH